MKDVRIWKQELADGVHAARLASLYCCAPEDTAPQAARYAAALDGLEAAFGPHSAAALFSAPGRTEIGGNHTDHQHGRVLAGPPSSGASAPPLPSGARPSPAWISTSPPTCPRAAACPPAPPTRC